MVLKPLDVIGPAAGCFFALPTWRHPILTQGNRDGYGSKKKSPTRGQRDLIPSSIFNLGDDLCVTVTVFPPKHFAFVQKHPIQNPGNSDLTT